ncbi:MAG: peptidoglycan DD-metalloendopeptidase family protein [Microcystaceae cyanobacterium]
MTQHPQGSNPFKAFNQCLPLRQSVSLIGGLSILGSSLVWSQAQATTNSLVIETTPAQTTPPPAPSAPVAPAEPVPQAVSRQQAPVASPLTTTPPTVQLSAPKISVPPSPPRSVTNPTPQTQPTGIQSIAPIAQPGKNGYIDTTSYGQGENGHYVAPSAVILTERSTGCQTISQHGKLTRASCGVAAKKPVSLSRVTASARPLPPPRLIAASRQKNALTTLKVVPPTVSYNVQGMGLNSSGQTSGSLAIVPLSQYNRATTSQPQTYSGNGKTALIFPLSIPAAITSAFGWRVHPISGTARMHYGTDIGAPIGTPVLAAYQGEVSFANWEGGYGLMVVLRHEEGTQESRYAHLSEIFVKPGDLVEQGTVIGLVGSTGFSTGPHLHFEWRRMTQEGWVAVDAGLHLEYALANLIQAMQMANAQAPTAKPGS